MGVLIETKRTLICDGCGIEIVEPTATADRLRMLAKQLGWIRDEKQMEDYCSNCKEK